MRLAVPARPRVARRARGGMRGTGVASVRQQLGEQQREDEVAGRVGVRAAPVGRPQSEREERAQLGGGHPCVEPST
jgi:hypothetical protein